MKNPLILLMLLFLSVSHAWAGDSTAVKVIGGKQYIIHKLEKGETLYAVSRKYKVPIQKIFDANPGMKDKYNAGDEIKVPVSDNVKPAAFATKKPIKPKPETTTATKSPSTPKTSSTAIAQPIGENKTPIYHNVTKGETVLKIAKNHKMTVSQLIKLNNLKNNNIEIGQMLIVGYDKTNAGTSVSSTAIPKGEIKSAEQAKTNDDIALKYRDEYNKDKKQIAKTKSENVVAREVDEEGVASWFDEGNVDIDKSLALHSTAPIGTIIKMTNLINHKVLYVKVIGRPDKTDNQNVVVKITKSAADKLGVLDKYFRVEMHYMSETVN